MKIKNKRLLWVLLWIPAVFMLSACGGDSEQRVIEDASTVDTTCKVYTISEDLVALEGVAWSYDSTTVDELVGECLEVLAQKPEEKRQQAAIQSPVAVEKYEYQENHKQVNVYFNSAYNEMPKEQELLCRAAVVKTLTQFDSLIDYVQFYIDGQVLKDNRGRAKRMMQSDFVDSTSADIKNLTESTLKLYFASTDGLLLASEDVYVHYLNTASVQQVIMESMKAGPLSVNLNRTFPVDTKLNEVTVSDSICYVDMNQRFLEAVDEQSFQIKVYSVVNSLCEMQSVSQVQILIDGSVLDYEEDGVNIGVPLSANMDIVAKQVDLPPAVGAASEPAESAGESAEANPASDNEK